MTRSHTRWAELARKRFGELRRLATRSGAKRAAKVALVAVTALYVVYVIAVNALLRLGGVEWFVNDSTDDAHLTLGPSHTWFPGFVEVSDLKLRFEDANVQFELSLARAKARVDLLALARKRLELSSLDADGVRFRFRHKVTKVQGNERRLLHFPRIEGFSDPPMLIPTPPTDKTKNWAFLLENVRARGVELWFMEYRYVGRADVSGAFELVPGRKLWVGPARADFHPGELGIGAKRPLARRVQGSLDFRFLETNPDPIPGLEIFRQISAKFSLGGDVVDLEAVDLYLSDASKTAVRRGAGRFDARVDLERGRFMPGSFVALRASEDVHVALPNSALRGRFATELRAEGRAPTRLVVEGSLSGAAMSLGAARVSPSPDVSAGALEATIVTNSSDVASPWTIEEALFRLRDGRSENLAAFDSSAPNERVLEGGAAWFFAHVQLKKEGSWSGALRADARRARVRIGERRLVLDSSLTAAMESEHRNLESGAIRDVALEVSGESVRSGESPLRVSAQVQRARWSRFPPGVAEGRATLRAPHIEPLLEAVGAPPILLGVWPDAPFDASARFVVEKDALDLRLDLAKSGPFRAMGRLRVCSPARGAFLVKSGVFSVGLSVRGDTVRVVPLAGEKWLAKNAPECPDFE